MRFLMVIDDLRSGGAQRQLVSLAIDFKKMGNEVHFLIYFPNFFYAEYLHANGIEYTCIENKQIINRIFSIRNFIRSSRPNVVIAFMGIPSILCNIAAIPTKRFLLISGERSADPKISQAFKSKIIRYFHIFSDFIVANSFENMNLIKKVNPFLGKSKLHVIYNSIDFKSFSLNKDYKFKDDGMLKVIIPASYRQLKNPIGLIEAVNQLSDIEKSKLHIDWYGDKTYESHLDNVIKECEYLIEKYNLSHVIFLNKTNDDIITLMQKYDAVGLFSFFEGLPNAICEGMACGKVIISSAVSDVPKLIKDRENGFLCNPYDISSIRSALQSLLKTSIEDLRKMGNLNRLKAEELFDNKLILNQYLNLIYSKINV